MRRAVGGRAGLEAIYRDRFAAFARVAISITGDAEAGRECVQEAFARAWEQIEHFRGDCPLEAWIWRIVVNTARTARSRANTVSLTATPDVDGTGDEHTDASPILAWLRALPERQRLVVFLRYWADLDYRTIADALEVEVGTVSATLNAAHRRLRSSLQEVPR
jgi:RNA polymerase sigma-70 factor (ECF subfamily)